MTQRICPDFPRLRGLDVAPASAIESGGAVFAAATRDQRERCVAVLAAADCPHFADFQGETSELGEQSVLVGPFSAHNATALRRHLEWLRPRVQGLRTTAGMGDRLGNATIGHMRAIRAAGGHIGPVPAQQSIREMQRTGRTAQEVLDDATWGVFAEGWSAGFGADADHLKVTADIDTCLAAGFTFFTFDPSEHVDAAGASATAAEVARRAESLPWQALRDTPESLRQRYLGKPIVCEAFQIEIDEGSLLRAAVKYGAAIAHVLGLFEHLVEAGRGQAWEVEISVDETEQPTTRAEHVYIASELRRLGVSFVSLAPRFIGRFEKGVDYIGDPREFAEELAAHAAIARTLGPYKLSLHSGSDKFSIYEASAELTRGLVHLKTAGTSYLVALGAIATVDPALFRSIYAAALGWYERDRVSYHVSADMSKAPEPEALSDSELPLVLDQFDARQILHVTFGSVLTASDAAGAACVLRAYHGHSAVAPGRLHGDARGALPSPSAAVCHVVAAGELRIRVTRMRQQL